MASRLKILPLLCLLEHSVHEKMQMVHGRCYDRFVHCLGAFHTFVSMSTCLDGDGNQCIWLLKVKVMMMIYDDDDDDVL